MRLLDTTFLIDLLRNKEGAVLKAKELGYENLFTTEINVFEIALGVYYKKEIDHRKYLEQALNLLSRLTVLPLNRTSSIMSGKIAAELMRSGLEIESNDVLIAGIALSNGISKIVTRNKEHFNRIKGITVETY